MNEKKYDPDIVGWITRGGKHIPIRKKDTRPRDLEDDDDFNTYVEKNIGNPEFLKYGQDKGIDAVKKMWFEDKHKRAADNAHETDIETATDTIRNGIPDQTMRLWFVEADSGIKEKLATYALNDPEIMNAGLNMAYYNYRESVSNPMPFEKWLVTPQTMYRGGRSRANDLFLSYTPDRKIAEGFGDVIEKKVRPIDTLGSYQTTGEQEFLVFQ